MWPIYYILRAEMNSEYFFFNVDFGQKLTGIERSSFKRSILFCEYLNIIPNFVTANLNLNLRKNWQHYQRIGWVPKQSKLFNVYEDIMQIERGKDLESTKIAYDEYFMKEISDTHQRFYKKNKNFNMYVVWKDEKKIKIDYINYFFEGSKVRRDKFNIYGQLALTQQLDSEGKILREDFFTPEGKLCLIKKYKLDSKLEEIYLYDQNGMLLDIFSKEDELIYYWCVKNIKEKSICIVDKNKIWINSLSALRNDREFNLISVVHNVHILAPYEDIYTDRLNANYKDFLSSHIYVDGCIILTPQQMDDIIEKFNPKYKIFNIPHANDNVIKKIEFSKRVKNKIISLARFDEQKQIDHMIEIMDSVVKTKNDIQLYIYGEGKLRKELEGLIKKYNLVNNVFLPGYTENIAKELNESVLFLSTSKTEGFPLAFLESMSHGVPVVSYDIKYGPKAIIQDGYNGFIVEKNNKKSIVDKIITIMDDHDLLKDLSNNSYHTASNFSMPSVAEIWKKELMRM